MSTRAFQLGNRAIGRGHPPLLLPDFDMFFNRDLDLAREMIRRLIASGVEVVKGAVLHDATIALDDGTEEAYYSPESGMMKENYRALIERKVLSLSEHEALFSLCHDMKMDFVLSVYDLKGATFAKDIGACGLKIPSSNVTHEPLIKHAAGLGLPLIIDTGKSTLEEIARAVDWARAGGADRLVVEHSPEAPPADVTHHNLRMLGTLQECFDCPVGLSDHHAGEEMLHAAVALGAAVLEKGVCDDRQPYDQDVYHAMRLSDVAGIKNRCDNIYKALGESMRVLPSERPVPTARMGLVAATKLRPGDLIDERNVTFAFPAKGIGCEAWSKVLGWGVRVELQAGEVVEWGHVQPLA